MHRICLLAAFALLTAPAYCQQPLVFEPQDCSSPQTAWGEDITPVDKWNLWSKDKDAEKKWSGGTVLQSPPVLEDRESPEEGAPVLHTVLTDIPDGAWVVTIKYGRDLAVSLDGKQWKRLSSLGGRLGRFEITGGRFEFWVDDLYAHEANPGFSYYDTITLTPSMPEVNGVSNGGFEFGEDFASSGWSFWSRDQGAGSAELVPEAHSGKRCVKFTHAGQRDFAMTGSGRLAVKPGETWVASAWMKCHKTMAADLAVVAMGKGKLITWSLAIAGVWDDRDWTRVEANAHIPDGCDQIYVRVVGSGDATVWVDDVALAPGEPPPPPKPKMKVDGWADRRARENLGRGLVALPTQAQEVYLSWRLLAEDPEGVAFNVYRARGRGLPVKLNTKPIVQTTDFVDESPRADLDTQYWVRPVVDGDEQEPSHTVKLPANPAPRPYVSIKLQGEYTFQKVGVADLNGDGKLDYVIKQPRDNIDPYRTYWKPSPDTYKLEAYLHDGTFLWRHDMGWAIERGIWYSPYLVYDFDGDGKAEVAVKSGEGDPRGPDGRVMEGPEYISILDGMTGEEKTRADWPNRDLLGRSRSSYNYASRNQIGIAFLDGKTPCLLVARGTYTVMQLVAYQYHEGELQELWTWTNTEEAHGNWRGQGAHWMHSGDVDGDGRDEVVLGSCVIDDDGKGLWTTGLGHPDRCFLTDVDPSRPGLEVFYCVETAQMQNGVCLADASTGEIIWGLKERTYHVGFGMTADIDPMHPGYECWGMEDGKGDPKGENYKGAPPTWLFSAGGELLARDAQAPSTFSCVYWDADALREFCRGSRIFKYGGQVVAQDLEGGQAFSGDILGDWREEIITSVPGEMRIYTTTIPATDRRVCLLQDPIYRHDVAHEAMGYTQPPVTSYHIRQVGSSLWMRGAADSIRHGEPLKITAMLAAPADRTVEGILKMTTPQGLSVSPSQVPVKTAAGGTTQAVFEAALQEVPTLLSGGKTHTLTLSLEGTQPLTATASLKAEEPTLSGPTVAQAESFSDQGGGEVQIRQDKVGTVGEAFSHWDSEGHWLSWTVQPEQDGRYMLVVRYCTPNSVQRQVQIDNGAPLSQTFPGTGGFGGVSGEWSHATLRDGEGKPLVLQLTVGAHSIKMTNADGQGMNMDYLALVPAAD